jgi:hypothetical protein
VGQVFPLRRERTIRGRTSVVDVYGITSLRTEEASPEKLLALIRSHWAVENPLFGVRDGTLGEDASRVRIGAAAQVAAGLRHAVVFLGRRPANFCGGGWRSGRNKGSRMRGEISGSMGRRP